MIDTETLDLIRAASTDALVDWWVDLQRHHTPQPLAAIGWPQPNKRSALLRLLEATVGQRTLHQALAERQRDVAGIEILCDAPGNRAAVMHWTDLANRMPRPDEHERVLIYTEGHDFNGEQVFDVRAETLNECFYADQDEQPDVCKLASHWAPHPKNAGI
jgi:hypothetical protein